MSHVSSDALKSPPRLNEIGRGRSLHWRVILVLAVLAGLALLFWLNPAQYAIYPRCAFYSMTGWQCPGCGGLRATHQMLHGNWGEAWALNPIAVLLVQLDPEVAAEVLHGLPAELQPEVVHRIATLGPVL